MSRRFFEGLRLPDTESSESSPPSSRGHARPSLALALALSLPASPALGASPCPAHMFVLERSASADIVVYDGNLGPTGELVTAHPVTAYWLLNARHGERQALTAIQFELAYGFEVSPGKPPGTFGFKLRADRGRPFVVSLLDGCPVTIGTIGGKRAILRRLFVDAKEEFLLPRVESVEISGVDISTGAPVSEKFVPK